MKRKEPKEIREKRKKNRREKPPIRKKRKEIKKPKLKRKFKRGIERKHYKKRNWVVRLISSESMGNKFMKFEQL